MNATDTIYAVATRATRLGWLEDEEGNGYHLEDDIHDLVEVRGTLDEVTRAIVAAVAPLGRLEWSAARAGYITANAGPAGIKNQKKTPNTLRCVLIKARSTAMRAISFAYMSTVTSPVHSASKVRAVASSPAFSANWMAVK